MEEQPVLLSPQPFLQLYISSFNWSGIENLNVKISDTIVRVKRSRNLTSSRSHGWDLTWRIKVGFNMKNYGLLPKGFSFEAVNRPTTVSVMCWSHWGVCVSSPISACGSLVPRLPLKPGIAVYRGWWCPLARFHAKPTHVVNTISKISLMSQRLPGWHGEACADTLSR